MLAANEGVVAAHADGQKAVVAAQDDGPPAAMAFQDGNDSEVPLIAVGSVHWSRLLPPKTLRDIYNGGISNAAVAKAIEKDCGVKATDVRKVLNSLAKIGMKELIRIGCFKLGKLARLKVALGRNSNERNFVVNGKSIHLKARPRGQVVKASVNRALQRRVKDKSLRRSCAVVWDERGIGDVIGPVIGDDVK